MIIFHNKNLEVKIELSIRNIPLTLFKIEEEVRRDCCGKQKRLFYSFFPCSFFKSRK